MRLPTLYKKTKTGKIQEWNISTSRNIIIKVHGQEDGQKVSSETIVTGKNIGSSNETTPEEQAILEAKSLWKKQKDKGYFESISDTQTEIVFLPMLAGDFEKRKTKITYPVYIQPKLDGLRCLASWQGDKIQLLSRGGKEYNIPHIAKELESLIHPHEVFDGEIYTHGLGFQDITKLAKKYREGETENLQFWVYDIFMSNNLNQPFSERILGLGELSSALLDKEESSINVLQTMTANCENSVYSVQKTFVEDGFEGAIVRTKDLKYELGHRSQNLLKVKSFMDDEYEITGYYEGKGNYKGCVTWICKTKKDQEFHCVPKGTLEEKREWFKNGDKYIGSMLKVKFFELTDDGIPRFPVGLGIRIPEDM